MMKASSHPNVRLTHTRMYTRMVTTMEAIVVKISATTRKAMPLFCFSPRGSCDVALMMAARLSPGCVYGFGRRAKEKGLMEEEDY